MILLPLLIILVTVALSIPVGRYLAWIMDGHYKPPAPLRLVEKALNTGPQNWKQYVFGMLLFNTIMFLVGYAFLATQQYQPELLNPEGKKTLAPTTIFNTAISFLTNTNLQDYSGEVHLSYMTQMTAILWNMFVSASVGFCALAAVIRGLRGDKLMGNYYVDMWRVVMYVFLPSSLIMGVVLMADGVPMTFANAAGVMVAEPGGAPADKAAQTIARGPVAAVIPIKHLGTNGGGFFGANSAHPFENPTSISNFLTCINILLFPFALVIMFGRMLGKMQEAWMIYGVMMSLFLVMIGWAVYWDTLQPNPSLLARTASTGQEEAIDALDKDGKPVKVPVEIAALSALPVDQNLGNLEGKELRFGTSAGSTFSAVTTAVTCGSVNCMHDSLNPLAGLTPFAGMWLNCVFGGKGVGLINLLVYLITGVFLAGLMVGRTPEYLGKKVEAREMKLAMLALLVHPLLILAPTGLFTALDWGSKSTNNPGAHGFSEILYQFSSSSANNGSGFEGLGDTWGFNVGSDMTGKPGGNVSNPAPYSPYWDIATGLVMLFGRFIPIVAPLALAASMASKKPTPFTSGTLRTGTVTFGFVLVGTILLVGALLFMPAAVLGPVAEHLGPMPFGQ
jgi:K+-transporting ATPase ATPase A chain